MSRIFHGRVPNHWSPDVMYLEWTPQEASNTTFYQFNSVFCCFHFYLTFLRHCWEFDSLHSVSIALSKFSIQYNRNSGFWLLFLIINDNFPRLFNHMLYWTDSLEKLSAHVQLFFFLHSIFGVYLYYGRKSFSRRVRFFSVFSGQLHDSG